MSETHKPLTENMLLLRLSLLTWMPAFLCKVTTETEFTVMEGRSLTVPCHYEPQYAGYVKYWCRGKTREFCSVLARSDDAHAAVHPSQARVSVFDDPVQLVFSVTMNNLREGDSGWYLCGVEIGGVWSVDDVVFTDVRVIHGLSVVNSMMRGVEGSSATIRCLYGERFSESAKKWCRSGDWRSCLSTGSDGTYEDSSVAIRDDRTGAFTITFKKLRMSDTGWYWCSVGSLKTSVHVMVTPQLTTTAVAVAFPFVTPNPRAHLRPPQHVSEEAWHGHGHLLAALAVCLALTLIGVMVLAGRKLWNIHRKGPLRREVEMMKAKHNCYSKDVDDFQTSAVVFLNKDSQEMHVC